MTTARREWVRAAVLPAEPVVRRLAVTTLINTFGNGLYMTISALYFTRVVGLSVSQVGLGLLVAGAFGVLAGVPAGQLADRVGADRLLVALVAVEGVGTLCLAQVGSFGWFLVVVGLTTTVDRAASSVRSALLAAVLPAGTRVRTRAYLRAVTNAGIGAGAACAGIALQIDTRAAYVTLILLDAASFAVSAVLLTGIRVHGRDGGRDATTGRRRLGRNPALRDGPYAAVSALNAVLSLQFGLVEVGLPLWIVGHTHAPRAMVSATLVLNTVLIVLLQVRASRGVTDASSAARVARRGGMLLAVCCLLFAGAAGVGPWVATGVLLVGMVVQTLAECACSVAGWELSYDLADPAAAGAYQGVYNSGFALAIMLAPLTVAWTALRFGTAGWAALAVLFAAAGSALVPVTRWARRRHAERFSGQVDATAVPVGRAGSSG